MNPGDNYHSTPAIVIFADDPLDLADQIRLAESLDGRVVAATSLAEAAGRLDDVNVGVVMLAAREDGGNVLDRLLDRIDLAVREGRYQSIVSVSANLIDVAAARAPNVTLLSGASQAEMTDALAVALTAASPGLPFAHEPRRTQLRSLSEEVGRIARSLAELSENGSAGLGLVNGASVEDVPPVTARMIREVIRARRLRDQFFASELFADPAWDMLLDLAAARLEGQQVAVSSLCIAAAVPATTALRWIKTLTDEGLFVRAADPHDGRRVFIELSEPGAAAITAYFQAVRRTGANGAKHR